MKLQDVLTEKGLTMSDAQSLSNKVNQQCVELLNKIDFNNFSESIKVDGEVLIITKPKPLRKDVLSTLSSIGTLRGLQAYLMEAMKSKNEKIERLKKEEFISPLDMPIKPLSEAVNLDSDVDESYGWSQLSSKEIVEYLAMEAKASTYGKFIHKNGLLTELRNELPNIGDITWMSIEEGKKIPVRRHIHNSAQELHTLYVRIEKAYREAEKKVNYYKAKVNNIVTLKNAEINKTNGERLAVAEQTAKTLRENYKIELEKYLNRITELKFDFEKSKNMEINKISKLRICVPEIFQSYINEISKVD